MSKIRYRNVACGFVNSRIFFSECGEAWQRLVVVVAIGHPKAVSEPPASAKCKLFHFVSGHSTRSTKIIFLCSDFHW